MKIYTRVSVACWLLALWPAAAHAYLDPASGSMLLQLILGGIAGFLVAVRLFWHKIVRLLPFKKSQSDETSD